MLCFPSPIHIIYHLYVAWHVCLSISLYCSSPWLLFLSVPSPLLPPSSLLPCSSFILQEPPHTSLPFCSFPFPLPHSNVVFILLFCWMCITLAIEGSAPCWKHSPSQSSLPLLIFSFCPAYLILSFFLCTPCKYFCLFQLSTLVLSFIFPAFLCGAF